AHRNAMVDVGRFFVGSMMRRFQTTIASLMALTLVVALLVASMINPSPPWAFVSQEFLVLFAVAAFARWLFHLVDRNLALHGFLIGGVAMVVSLLIPIPIMLITGSLSINNNIINQIIAKLLPLIWVFPIVGAAIGWKVRRPSEDEETSDGRGPDERP